MTYFVNAKCTQVWGPYPKPVAAIDWQAPALKPDCSEAMMIARPGQVPFFHAGIPERPFYCGIRLLQVEICGDSGEPR